MAQRFKIGGHIGSGGFGTVDEATRIDSDGHAIAGRLARKKLLDEHVNDAEAVNRFKREVRYLDEMDHPNVIEVVGRNLTDSPPWFVMPYAESSLQVEIQAGRGGDRDWVIKTFSAVLAGMAYAHGQRRILHRDLKPENVLICGGIPKLSDFGLGKRLDLNTVNLTSMNIGMGTVAYMAPEQFVDAARVGPPADVYALGKILWEMLTGQRPVIGRPRLDSVPESFRSFIDRCTQDNPSDRYANANDALAAFQLLISGGGTPDGDDLESLLKQWDATPEGQDTDEVRDIAQFLVARRADEELYFRAVPRLPPLLVRQLIHLHGGDFEVILRAYNDHVQGALPFEYCDVLANFYRQVFLEVEDLAQRRLILERLIELGPSHNRWHVGSVFSELLEGIDNDETAQVAAGVVGDHPIEAQWYLGYVANRNLRPPIRAAFNALDRKQSDDPW